jgi:hypothetical protein
MKKISILLAAVFTLAACDSMDGVFRNAPIDAPAPHVLNDLPIQMRGLI